ncbi:tripartite motif-containing protein 16-like [Cebidichthys violaceus]|uniref:tripartite motif-containing protein 16-like n=1 Tax=Cebidichthys violaceus TaxID=271503 RepID=UPI0035C976E1
MAEQGYHLDPEMLGCLICLDLLKDPVTIPCGHSYCMSCIRNVWDEENQKTIHSCPQCTQIFTARPVLVRNTMLADLVEELKKTGLQADRSYAGPEDVACDVCTGRNREALKSCLSCQASFCEQHLQLHCESPLLEKHELVSLTEKLRESVCSPDNKVKSVHRHTHQECACYLCSTDEHTGHNTISAAAERTERQRELKVSRQTIQQRIQKKKTAVKVLQMEVEALNRSADKAVDDSEEIFTGLISTIKKQSHEVNMQIRSRQKTEVSRVTELQEKLEEEIANLRRKDAELEQLSNTADDTRFPHRKPSLTCLDGSTDLPSSYTRPLQYLEDVTAAVSEVRDKLHGVLNEQWPKISRTVAEVDVLLIPPEPTTRAELLRYSCQITLDPNTVHTHVLLSEGNRKATLVKTPQLYRWHPDRFRERWQVLSKEGLTGRCYWEVKRSGVEVLIAVAYKDIIRSGTFDACAFGNNSKSWGLASYKNGYQFKHRNIRTPVSGPRSSRVGVYLDHRAGILSFYSVSETMTLLHRVQTTFTQPLYAGFWLPNSKGDTVELCSIR